MTRTSWPALASHCAISPVYLPVPVGSGAKFNPYRRIRRGAHSLWNDPRRVPGVVAMVGLDALCCSPGAMASRRYLAPDPKGSLSTDCSGEQFAQALSFNGPCPKSAVQQTQMKRNYESVACAMKANELS